MEIKIQDFKEFNVNHIEDNEAKTGASIIYFKNGATVGVDISGGGPASCETPLCLCETANNPLNAIVLAGGSAFGLACRDGVVKCLEERGIGYDTSFAKVPLVVQSCIYDLSYGKSDIRPDSKMGYEVCLKALTNTSDKQGNVGAGCGATVGKLLGMQNAQK